MIPLIVLVLILVVLAVPPALKKRSWLWFFIALVLSFAGVVLPLFIFLFSIFMTPEWKGACNYGWVDCFIEGKLALLPLVLWATAALYAVEILRVENCARRWIVLGIFLGAIIAAVCFVFGVACLGSERGLRWWLLVPLYVAAWHLIRARQLTRAAPFDFWTYFISFIGSLPLWLASWIWSKNIFESLPDDPGGCFIVTAAGRGHKKCVGPLIEITRHGRQLQANQQLLTFWQFENLWRNHASRSHQIFRRYYNQIGPVVARQIKSPWQADLVHLALKPMELVARLANKTRVKN